MPPVKRKKRPAPKSSRSLADTSHVVTASAPSSSTQFDPLSASSTRAENPTDGPLPAVATATDVADQLHSAAIHLLRRLRVRDRESGIGPAQLSALSVLVFGGPKSLGELADAEQVRPPTMSRIVASLHRSRLVRRHATEDGRRVRLEATPKGVGLMWEGRQRRVESLAKAVAGLPESEQLQLRDALTLLQQVIRKI
jgi:DNA-binding MarR family transcriptional regulator